MEEIKVQNNDLEQKNKSLEEIKDSAVIFIIFGCLKIIMGIWTIFSNIYADSFISIVLGILYVILASRIYKKISANTKYYLITILSFLLFFGFGNFIAKVISGEGGEVGLGIALILSFVAFKNIKKLKHLETEKSDDNYKLSGKKWFIFGIASVLFVIAGIFLDIKDTVLVKDIPTDKNIKYSEVTGDMYRNTKYGFRIKFPENWEIKPGDGIHIVQKASFENSTISIMVQQFDLSGSKGFTSIKDAGTSKEFIDTVIEGAKEKFSDVKIINYGKTKIDNEPAYWVEYSISSQILDYQLKITQLVYFLAKGDTMYSINTGTATDEYSKIKPLFVQTVSTFVLENY